MECNGRSLSGRFSLIGSYFIFKNVVDIVAVDGDFLT